MGSNMKVPTQYDRPISATGVVNLLWKSIAQPGERRREAASRIRSWLSYCLKTGKLANSSKDFSLKNRTFDPIQILLLARQTWPGRVKLPSATYLAEVNSHASISTSIEADVIPGTLEKCQDRLMKALDELEQLNAALSLARKEAEELREQNRSFKLLWSRAGCKTGRG